MRQAGKITAGARSIARQAIKSGVTTRQINKYVHEFILKSGAKPTFLGYGGFPASACVSVNEEVIHGIPGKRVIHCLLYTSPSPRDVEESRMPSSA